MKKKKKKKTKNRKTEFFSESPGQTKKIGKEFARNLLKVYSSKEKDKKGTIVVGLEGELGTGKTTFLQGFAKGFGIKGKILSPTFVIIKKFKIKKLTFKSFYHIDCYRIKKPKELLELGFKEIVSNPDNIVVIEWANQVKKIMPRDSFWINFRFIDKKRRRIKINTILEK